MRLTTYDPKKIQLSIAGSLITGFAPGRMIEYRPDDVVFRDEEGVDGEVARWARKSPLGTLTITLTQSATANGILSDFLNLDRLSQAALYPIILEDKSSDSDRPTRLIFTTSWIQAQPDIVFEGAAASGRQWDFRVTSILHDTQGLKENIVLV